MRKIFFVTILFTCFLVGCSKDYELKIFFDDEILTYNISNNEFNIDDIEKKENYEYLGLYLDYNYQKKFDGIVNDDLTLYLKYNKYYNVIVKINDNVSKNYKILENNYFDESIITLNDNEKLVGLYYDNTYIKEYNKEIIEGDLILFALIKKELSVNIYDKDKFIETINLLEGDSVFLPSYALNPRYQNIKYYLDSEYQVEYKDKLDNTNLYIKYDINESLNEKVVILIKGEDFIINYQINKGENLKSKDIIKLLSDKIGYSANYHLYLDNEYKKSFNHGPISEDIILYAKTYENVNKDLEIKINYDFSDSKIYFIQNNTSFNVDDLDAVPNKYFYGLYWDENYKLEYNNEILNEEVELYALYKNTPKDNVSYHTVNVYIADASLGLDEIKNQNAYTLWYTYYIEDGKYIPNLSFRNPYYPNIIIHAFYKNNYNVPYYEDVIEDDLELYCIYNEHVSYDSKVILEKEELVINNKVINYYKAFNSN